MTVDRRNFLAWAGIAPVAGCAATSPATRADGSSDSWLEISLPELAWNLKQLRAHTKNRPVMAVVKGNAYGHGLVEVGRFLEEQKVAALAVGKLDEAVALREAGVRVPILNLGPVLPDRAKDTVRLEITQTVYDFRFAHLARAASELGRPARVQINIDTGLGRVGVQPKHARAFLTRVAETDGVSIEGVFTALTEDPEFDAEQLKQLQASGNDAQRRGVPIPVRHAASSAACLSNPDAWLDMVRPGIALYGHYPSDAEAEKRRIDLKPVMQWKAQVSCVKTLERGDSVSYHRAFVAKRWMRLATLAVGYSDGYPHEAATQGHALVGGKRCKLVGLVTANHVTVDATGADVKVGDEAVLFGQQHDARISAVEVGKWSGTSVYKTLIETNPLLPRRFVRE